MSAAGTTELCTPSPRLLRMLLYDFGHPASSHGPRSNMDHGTVMVKIPQRDSPALLVSMTHTTSDLLSAATLKNVSQMSLSACRLG